jgi:ABC-type siderophore export system fused ATPase/permease subunit
MKTSISVVAKTTFAILAVTAIIGLVGYINTLDTKLLDFTFWIVVGIITGSIVIAIIVHLPRIIRALRCA